MSEFDKLVTNIADKFGVDKGQVRESIIGLMPSSHIFVPKQSPKFLNSRQERDRAIQSSQARVVELANSHSLCRQRIYAIKRNK